jgi:RTX calcium-binding nonapeptide repeat (4 copies)
MSPQLGRAGALRIGITIAVAIGLLAAPTAGAVTYPKSGGNGFDKDTQGWTGIAANCQPSLGGLCSEKNEYSSKAGNPKGSIESRTEVLANAADLFSATATWRSPSFDATTTGAGTLKYDRRLEASGLLTAQPTATVTAVLVDQTDKSATPLGSETLSGANSAFAANAEIVRAGTLKLGHRYHLELRTNAATAVAQAGLLGTITVRFDNVDVTLHNTGGGGSSGSPGVEFTGPPITGGQVGTLSQQTPLGGGLSSRQKCTIVGTSHADRIRGTNGNDVICGLGGKDRINGRGGRDIIDGGSGADRISGSKGKDVLVGVKGKDRLKGGAGKDRLGGGPGKDRLAGGPGRDRLNGGPGKDLAVGSRHDKLVRVERRR